MRLLKIVNKNKQYAIKDEKGKDTGKYRYQTTFFVELDNKKLLAIKPVFTNDYQLLNFVADLKVIDIKDKKDDLPF